MNEIALEVRDVDKSFRGKPVLRGLSFAVETGQTFAFLGRNGAGKTTTIQMLMGLLSPDAGSIRVLGRDPQRESLDVRRTVGYLAEDQTMFGWMTVAQVIRFVGAFYPTWDHPFARRLCEQFALPLATKVRHLSKGENVRLGLLLALAHRPELVILDDPALGLDPIMRREFNRDLVVHLQAEGCTVLYSSHLLYEVEPVADVVAILHEGRIVRQSGTDELRRQVKRLILAPQVFEQIAARLIVLDGQQSAGEIILTVDNAPDAVSLLHDEDVSHRMEDLSLDEIFEAFVAGRPNFRLNLPEAAHVPQPT